MHQESLFTSTFLLLFFLILKPTNGDSDQTLPTVFAVFQATPGQEGTTRLYFPANHDSSSQIPVVHDIRRLPHNVKFINSLNDAHLELSI